MPRPAHSHHGSRIGIHARPSRRLRTSTRRLQALPRLAQDGAHRLGAPKCSDCANLKGLRDRAILAVLLGCGLRRSEPATLRLPISSNATAADALSI